MNKKIGKQSFFFTKAPIISTWASVAGKKESEGPLASYFDKTFQDTHCGQNTWEQGEQQLQTAAIDTLLEKAQIKSDNIDVVFSGDLLNQCIGSSFVLRNKNIPHFGLYGACSTMAESLLLASISVGGGFFDRVIAMTSSHFASSERQYRFPLNYGGQRPPTAQWTVTGAGAALVCATGKGPRITGGTVGCVVDLGIKDANNMGAAMAPAAFNTIYSHFRDFQVSADDYDLIVTGDLGQTGKELLLSLCSKNGISIGGKLVDCGTLIFDVTKQDTHSGGSGCGCSAATLCSYFLPQLSSGKLKKILFCGTGALLSPTSCQQSASIPAVCHAVVIEGAII